MRFFFSRWQAKKRVRTEGAENTERKSARDNVLPEKRKDMPD